MTPEEVDVATRAGETFVKLYYRLFDRERHKLLKLYIPDSVMVWNGNPKQGTQITDFLLEFPSSEYQIHQFDCQAVGQNLLLQVTGNVKLDKSYNFSQTFVLKPHESGYVIGSDVFRFI
ncbi:hypothetical protein EDD86DRAFT_206143 [Gorgonomyces haynaldii]|nr:hypothetical protein EDD86DRAFT_206143 [Gorgonomyces haynaldii]